MTTAPDDKQGVASAVNDARREIGAALGIALAGSMMAAQYPKALAPKLIGLPPPVRDGASSSLSQALEIAKRMGPLGIRVADASQAAFIDAMHSSLLVLAIVIAVSAVLIGLWAPGRDDQQLRPVRLLLARRRAK